MTAAKLQDPAAGGPVPSPCTNVCRIDAASGWCLGCRRSIDEIAQWSRLDDAAKRAIWARLDARPPSPLQEFPQDRPQDRPQDPA